MTQVYWRADSGDVASDPTTGMHGAFFYGSDAKIQSEDVEYCFAASRP